MIVALTGTPGTGKTSVSEVLRKNQIDVIDFNKIACEKNFIIKKDEKRNSNIVDIKKFDNFINKNYSDKKLVFIEGHLSHLLSSIDKIIILRCHPEKLRKNLVNRNWSKEKINENVEAEILDIILCECLEIVSEKNIFEIDVTNKTVDAVSKEILEIISNKFKNMKKYKIGKIDWSEEIMKDF
jgi:adenylate kinase